VGILITGAQLENKGAQAMLYVTVSELRKRFPQQELYFATGKDYDASRFRFRKVICTSVTKHLSALEGAARIRYAGVAIARDCVALLLGKKRARGHYFDLLRLPDIDAIMDVSGFAIGNQWSRWSHISYLDMIRFAEKRGIPMYLLPQSFGPFDYGDQEAAFDDIMRDMRSLLRYPRLIFSRERSATEALRSLGITENVRQSADLVLQNRGIDDDNVFTQPPERQMPVFDRGRRVAVIPNRQCVQLGNREKLLALYRVLIRELDELNYETVILRHSSEDRALCEEIRQQAGGLGSVSVLDRDFDCEEFSSLIRQFDFAVCSRYHSIVHAYRERVPCVILGWADKYREIAETMDQTAFHFDVLEDASCAEALRQALRRMRQTLDVQREAIGNRLEDIQKRNCFDQIEADMRSLGIKGGFHDEQRQRAGQEYAYPSDWHLSTQAGHVGLHSDHHRTADQSGARKL
jgi:Uncharacterized conserved protein